MLQGNQSCVERNNISLKLYDEKGSSDWPIQKDLAHSNVIIGIVVSLIETNMSQGCLRVPSTYLLSCYDKIIWFLKNDRGNGSSRFQFAWKLWKWGVVSQTQPLMCISKLVCLYLGSEKTLV